MYANPRDRRDYEIKIRLNERELAQLNELAMALHLQRGVLARRLIQKATVKLLQGREANGRA